MPRPPFLKAWIPRLRFLISFGCCLEIACPPGPRWFDANSQVCCVENNVVESLGSKVKVIRHARLTYKPLYGDVESD